MKKINLFLLASILFFGFSTSKPVIQKKENCSEARTGKFLIVEERFNHRSEITRSDSTQYEIDLNSKKRIDQKIEWLSDCVYTLETIGDESHKPEQLRGIKLVITIDSIVSKVTYFTAYPENMDHMKASYSMTKVSD